MKPDIITEGFLHSEEMHGVRYMRFIERHVQKLKQIYLSSMIPQLAFPRHIRGQEIQDINLDISVD